MTRGRPRTLGAWGTSFGQWLSGYGVSRLAATLTERGYPISRGAIYHWLTRTARPRPRAAQIIASLSDGQIPMAEFYEIKP